MPAICLMLLTSLGSLASTSWKMLMACCAFFRLSGLDTPDNLKNAQQAISIFQEVLAKDPNDVNSIKQIAGIYFSVNKLSEAKDWQKKVLAVDPKDPEAAYTVGVIDSTTAHKPTLAVL